jgi:prephenate dehydratase
MTPKVSIQGFEGSFHQIAAQVFFGKKVEVVGCSTFRQVVKLAEDPSKTNGGVMAIENSIAGSILPNYDLLHNSQLTIRGEVYLQIDQNLLTNPGVKLEDIREVHSHPMALLQCMAYLENHPHWKLVETDDTAASAKYIHQHRHKHAAAIASVLAAQLYDLTVLAPKIQTEKNNYTRFLILDRENNGVQDPDKASIHFQTTHEKGSLAKVLSVIAEGGLNLTKIQSFPIAGGNWKYRFYVDTEFDTLDQFNEVMEGIKPLTKALQVQGIYKRGKTALTKS